MEPATVPLVADRWTPFVHRIEYQGENLTGAAMSAHVRLTPDAPGTPALSFANGAGAILVYGGTASVADHLAAGRISEVPEGMATTDLLPLSIIQLEATEAGMEAMPFPADRGDDALFYWDMHITPAGGTKQVYFRGTFTVRAGATQ